MTRIEKVEGATFSDEYVPVSGRDFYRCKFINCLLLIEDPCAVFAMNSCSFYGRRGMWFVGPAFDVAWKLRLRAGQDQHALAALEDAVLRLAPLAELHSLIPWPELREPTTGCFLLLLQNLVSGGMASDVQSLFRSFREGTFRRSDDAHLAAALPRQRRRLVQGRPGAAGGAFDALTGGPFSRILSPIELAHALRGLCARWDGAPAPLNHALVVSDCRAELGGWSGMQRIASNHPSVFAIWRARPMSQLIEAYEFITPSDMSHPPAHLTGLGRANLPYAPVFYGASSLLGAIRELRAPEQRRYVVGLWVSRPIELLRANFAFSRNLSADWLVARKREAVEQLSPSNGNPSSDVAHVARHLEAWSDLFVTGPHEISASLAYDLMEGPEAFDAVLYSSAIDGGFQNVALRTARMADFELVRAYDFDASRFDAPVRAVGLPKDGVIRWTAADHDHQIWRLDAAAAASVLGRAVATET